MFTGLIEAIGTIQSIEHTPAGSRFIVAAPDLVQQLELGASIAVNGACTTVVELNDSSFAFDASLETLRKTTFLHYHEDDRVNLELPLLATSRLGGHYVTGHVDGTATLVAKNPDGLAWCLTFELDQPDLSRYVISKGSIAIDGISLTVNSIEDCQFSVAIILHTMTHTTLSDCHLGTQVNIETDLLGKYVEKLLDPEIIGRRLNDLTTSV